MPRSVAGLWLQNSFSCLFIQCSRTWFYTTESLTCSAYSLCILGFVKKANICLKLQSLFCPLFRLIQNNLERTLRGMNTLVMFSAIFQRRTTFITFCLLSWTSCCFGKVIYFERGEFAAKEQIFSFWSRPLLTGEAKNMLNCLPCLFSHSLKSRFW